MTIQLGIKHPKIPHSEVLRLAAQARVTVDTIRKTLNEDPVRGDAGVRAREALVGAGYLERTDEEKRRFRQNARTEEMIAAHKDRVRRILAHGDDIAEELTGRSVDVLRRFVAGDPTAPVFVLRAMIDRADAIDAFFASLATKGPGEK